MRIVVPFGFYGWGNIGDEATLNGFAQLLAQSGTRAHVSVGSQNPTHTARVEPAFRYFSPSGHDPHRWWAKLRASAHAVVGGTPIMDVLGDWPLEELTPLVRAIDRWKVPLVFIGVGIENLRWNQSRLIVATEIVPRVRHWSVRCQRDRQRLIAYRAAPDDITVAADMAWLIRPATDDYGRDFLRRLNVDLQRPLIGVNVVNENSLFDREPKVADALAGALDALAQELDASVVFVANEVREDPSFDKAAARQVIGRMRRTDRVVLAPNDYLSPREMMSIISCCDLTISMRYHFCLFSALQDVPFIAVERCDKVSDLCWDMNWLQRVVPPRFDAGEVIEHGRQLRQNAAAVDGQLKQTVQMMRERALRNVVALRASRNRDRGPSPGSRFHHGKRATTRPLQAESSGNNVTRHYYLSEMAVSDKHGGGLSLQRVLQEDLRSFELFVHLSNFAKRDAPIVEWLADRQWSVHEVGREWWVRQEFDQWMGRLHLKMFHRWSRDRWIRRMAAHILSYIAPTECSWLVVPQSILAIRVMNEVWRRRPVRYVTWMMDDHMVRWENGWHYPRRFETQIKFHLQHAEKVFVISPTMGRFYRDRFGVDSDVLFGPADPRGEPVYRSPNPTGPVRLVYFGSIWDWQRDALERLITHLGQFNATLDLFVFHDPPSELRSPLVSLRPPVQAKDVQARAREYDGVVIPASFNDNQRHLTELNIATKLSECYASGTVPVIVAPPYAAMAEFAKEHGGALVVSDFVDPRQMDALRNLKSPDFRKGILEEARQVADSQCSYAVMRRRWTQAWHDQVAEPASASNPMIGNVVKKTS